MADSSKDTEGIGRDSGDAPDEMNAAEVADAELVARSQSGDAEAFDELVIRYRGKIYAMIVNMIHNEADAWDLAQDTFLKAWKALPKFKAKSNFYTWLYRISHNVTYDWLRRKQNRVSRADFDETFERDDLDSEAPTAPRRTAPPDTETERGELRRQLEAAIDSLSPEHRAVILLKEVEGLSYQEIADAVECSIGTVMSRLFYARKNLQQKLASLRDPA